MWTDTEVAIVILVVLLLILIYFDLKRCEPMETDPVHIHSDSKEQIARQKYVDSKSGEVSSYSDYGEYVKYMGLTEDIIKSHDEYTNDLDIGAGRNLYSERDDRVDINPRVGFRPIYYNEVPISGDVRTEPSVYLDQMPETGRNAFDGNLFA